MKMCEEIDFIGKNEINTPINQKYSTLVSLIDKFSEEENNFDYWTYFFKEINSTEFPFYFLMKELENESFLRVFSRIEKIIERVCSPINVTDLLRNNYENPEIIEIIINVVNMFPAKVFCEIPFYNFDFNINLKNIESYDLKRIIKKRKSIALSFEKAILFLEKKGERERPPHLVHMNWPVMKEYLLLLRKEYFTLQKEKKKFDSSKNFYDILRKMLRVIVPIMALPEFIKFFFNIYKIFPKVITLLHRKTLLQIYRSKYFKDFTPSGDNSLQKRGDCGKKLFFAVDLVLVLFDCIGFGIEKIREYRKSNPFFYLEDDSSSSDGSSYPKENDDDDNILFLEERGYKPLLQMSDPIKIKEKLKERELSSIENCYTILEELRSFLIFIGKMSLPLSREETLPLSSLVRYETLPSLSLVFQKKISKHFKEFIPLPILNFERSCIFTMLQ